MAITYRIHEDLGLVVTQYLDTVTDDEFVMSCERLLNDPEMHPGYNELVDLGDCKILKLTEAGMREVGRLMEIFLRDYPEGMRTAVVAPDKWNFAFARM